MNIQSHTQLAKSGLLICTWGILRMGFATNTRAQSQVQDELGRFSTGPPIGSNDGKPLGGNAQDMPLSGDDVFSRVDGTDIRVNQVTTSSQDETSFAANPLDREIGSV